MALLKHQPAAKRTGFTRELRADARFAKDLLHLLGDCGALCVQLNATYSRFKRFYRERREKCTGIASDRLHRFFVQNTALMSDGQPHEVRPSVNVLWRSVRD